MHKLSQIILLIVLTFNGFAQSPHGDQFKIDCTVCHTSDSWKVMKTSSTFDHNTTKFKLTGQHQNIDCKACHQSLKFQEAKKECISCHTDLHQNTLGTDCVRCHNTKAWVVQNTITIHQLSRFPLVGNHAVADCSSCHKSASNFKYEPQGLECIDCHRINYMATTSPNHQKLGYSTNCNECHGVKATSWNESNFEHSFFPLTGGHSISCADCHKDGTYRKIPNDCVSCHQKDYNSTTKPNHQQINFSTSCAECHTTNPGWNPANYKQHDAQYFPIYSGTHKGEWNSCTDCHTNNNYAEFTCTKCHAHEESRMKSAHVNVNGYSPQSTACFACHPQGSNAGSFNHNSTNFPLTGSHLTTDCLSCHAKGYAGTTTECQACHQAKYNSAQLPNHTAAGISTDCKTCHTTADWKPSSFKHSTTGYELTGGHAAVVQCSDCHKGNTTTAKTECISCHQAQYNNAKGHVASKFPTDCTLCHTSNNWVQVTFDHNKTNFPLTGSHIIADCASCHATSYAGTSTECNSCHQAKYTAAQVPSHTAAGISVECKTCHSTTDWKPSSFNHTTTGFALSGGHAAIVQCSSCHKGNTTSATTECISCHQAQYNGAKDHVASKFPTNCTMCHNSNNWLNATFDHSLTSFPLTGSHVSVECASCHTTGYAGTSSECKSCHQAKYTAAQVPSHTAAGISVECKTCHTTTDWKPSSFNHTTTGFALTGGHAAVVQCSSCHKGNTTSATPECISCHQVQYNNAPGHVASKFPTDCKLCHNSNNWLNATFDHSTTSFPLTGSHVSVECASCHTSGYAGTSPECKSCHQAKYTAAQVPSHTAAGISVDCKTCHTTTDWKPSSFNHTTTGFALTGGHASVVQCSSCHHGNTSSASPDCITCHEVQYNGAKDHVASKFPKDCRICHNSVNWLQLIFNHSTTKFPLTGAHTTTDCISCHASGYVGTATSCNSCHLNDYNQATNPNHKSLGLSVTCTDCHTTVPGWQPALFPNHSTYFALTGAHATIAKDCAACHKGVYSNTPKTCYDCHTTDYNNTKNPAHQAAQFPTDCKSCHTVNAWIPSTFNHTNYFPISSGRHAVSCSICHTTPTNYTIFTCVTSSCHTNAHNRSQGSAGCYRCHPTGRGD